MPDFLIDDRIIPTAAAFLIGAVFGALVGLGLMGESGSPAQAISAAKRSVAGSAVGALFYLATGSWWPEIIGPFLFAPPTAMAAAVLFHRRNK